MKLVTREEFDVVVALAQAARTEQEVLAERLAALEARLAQMVPAPETSKSVPPATNTKPKPARRRRAEAQ
jgi:BMFP domain-containing protein YqiC